MAAEQSMCMVDCVPQVRGRDQQVHVVHDTIATSTHLVLCKGRRVGCPGGRLWVVHTWFGTTDNQPLMRMTNQQTHACQSQLKQWGFPLAAGLSESAWRVTGTIKRL